MRDPLIVPLYFEYIQINVVDMLHIYNEMSIKLIYKHIDNILLIKYES
jgi:hypothetical protein